LATVAHTTPGDVAVNPAAIVTTSAPGSTAFPAYPASSRLSASTAVLSSTASSRGSTKGAEIRAKIAANRAKRLKIADAMKKEAGVTDHTVNHEDLGGLAYIGTARIYSPEGRKIVQLYTLAHECGHIFLHNSGAGYTLPGHVKEFEAESYAHQAFREHGMTVPRSLSNGGRNYVGSWIDKDRAANIPIDPHAMEYAAGRRSRYEPLRMVPATWQIFHAAAAPTERTVVTDDRGWIQTIVNRALRRLGRAVAPVAREASAVCGLAANCFVIGTTVYLYGFSLIPAFNPSPPRQVILADIFTAVAVGLWLANLAVLWRTTTR
jgi:hypothetical protein